MLQHNTESICQFPRNKTDYESTLNIVHFVYEPHPLNCEQFEIRNYFTLYFVISGTCAFETDYKKFDLKKGDMFFVFPDKRFKYTHDKAKFIYISFTNIEAKQTLDRLNVSYVSPVVRNQTHLITVFKKEFEVSRQNLMPDLTAKGLLFLTFGHFYSHDNTTASEDKKHKTIKEIVAYIDKNYQDADLTLKKLSDEHYYHFNYISQTFKEIMGVPFVKYITSVRIKKAQTLLETTNLSIAQVADAVGFKDSSYFEKVFKKIKQITPTKYRDLYSVKK